MALGIALDTTYSYLAGLLPQAAWQRVLNLPEDLGFALYDPRMEDAQPSWTAWREFQEHLGGRLTVMLLWDIGQGMEVQRN